MSSWLDNLSRPIYPICSMARQMCLYYHFTNQIYLCNQKRKLLSGGILWCISSRNFKSGHFHNSTKNEMIFIRIHIVKFHRAMKLSLLYYKFIFVRKRMFNSIHIYIHIRIETQRQCYALYKNCGYYRYLRQTEKGNKMSKIRRMDDR